MTTIAVNKDMIAGDKQFTYHGEVKMKGVTKIYELPVITANILFECDKVFIGFAGGSSSFSSAIEWIYDPTGQPPRLKNIEFLALTERHQIFLTDNLAHWHRIGDPYFSIGSGSEFALGAMAAGKTPYEAVKIASKYDVSTGMGFNKLEL